jgi:hypothetical protein
MWAQLIKVRRQPGFDMTAWPDVLTRFEQRARVSSRALIHARHEGCGFGLCSLPVRERGEGL